MSDFPKVTGVELEPVKPDPSDLRKIAHMASKRGTKLNPVTWVVRVLMEEFPEPTGLGLELLVGDQPVRKYTQVDGGVAFVVNDPKQLRALMGKEVSWRVPGTTDVQDTGARLTGGVPFPPVIGISRSVCIDRRSSSAYWAPMK